MDPLLDEPAISLLVREHEEPGIEVRVNFGVFAGGTRRPPRSTSSRGSRRPRAVVRDRRRRSGTSSRTPSRLSAPGRRRGTAGARRRRSADVLAEQIVLAANGWALECIASRHGAGEL